MSSAPPEAEGVGAVEVVGGVPPTSRHERPQLLAELAELVAQVGVVEQRLGEAEQLVALVRASSS